MMVLIGIVLVFAIGGGFLYMNNQITPKNYTSAFMKMGFDYPSTYNVTTKQTTGEIFDKARRTVKFKFGTYGTNYLTANDHVKNLMTQNNIQEYKVQEVQSPYSAVVLESIVDNKTEKSYFFVKDYAAYYFSADDPALFSDLDSIAKSFRILQ
jgi:hypothetical protein